MTDAGNRCAWSPPLQTDQHWSLTFGSRRSSSERTGKVNSFANGLYWIFWDLWSFSLYHVSKVYPGTNCPSKRPVLLCSGHWVVDHVLYLLKAKAIGRSLMALGHRPKHAHFLSHWLLIYHCQWQYIKPNRGESRLSDTLYQQKKKKEEKEKKR